MSSFNIQVLSSVWCQKSKFCIFVTWNKTTATALKWADRGYPPVGFEFKTASEGYLDAEVNNFIDFGEKMKICIFLKTAKTFLCISQ